MSAIDTFFHVQRNGYTSWGEHVTGSYWHSDPVNLWFHFYFALATAPNRVRDCEAADFVFLPYAFPWTQPKLVDTLVDAKRYLPLLGRKPHVLVLACPLNLIYCYGYQHARHRGLLRDFTFLTNEYDIEVAGTRGYLTVPYYSKVHYTPDDAYFTAPPDVDALAASKQKLIVAVFQTLRKDPYKKKVLPHPLRMRLRAECEAQPSQCTFDDAYMTYAPRNVTFAVNSRWGDYWYCMQPPGDSLTRGSMYDCLMQGTIPVLTDGATIPRLAFPELIDWRRAVLVVPPGEANVVDWIVRQHTQAGARERLAYIAHIKRLLQFMLLPQYQNLRFEQLHLADPLDDAFTSSIKALVRSACASGDIRGCPTQQPAPQLSADLIAHSLQLN